MNILETVTTYWNEFATIYEVVLKYSSWKIITVVAPSLFTLGLIRTSYCYAKGHSIGAPNHSMFSLRIVDYLFTALDWQSESNFKEKLGYDSEKREHIYGISEIGSNLLGTIFDVGVFTIVLLLIFLVWPIAAFVSATVGPLHACRVYNLRKKAFIASLKGEESAA
jgi:hypothetical protein